MQLVIRKYQRQDKDAVCSLFTHSTLEFIRPCFYNSVSSPLHLLTTVALCTAGYLLGSVFWSLVLPGLWIALIYYCCHNVYSRYVQLKLRTDMKDISASFLRRPDDCFWVAEAEIDGTLQILGTVAIKTTQRGEERQAQLCRLAITSSCRGMGLGIRMAKAAIDFCKERGILELVLETSSPQMPAVNLYKKLGFSIDCTHNGVYISTWMVKLARIQIIKMKLCL